MRVVSRTDGDLSAERDKKLLEATLEANIKTSHCASMDYSGQNGSFRRKLCQFR
jgi:hypothetical protein